MTFPLKALLASSALLLSAGAAFAAPATATVDLNVRAGPGTNYPVIDALPAGETVNVLGCTGSWCEISMGGGSGFASANYLERAGRAARTRVIVEEDEPEIIGLSIGGYWDDRPYYYDGGHYYYGGRWYRERPGRSGWERSWRREYRRSRDRDERREVRRRRDTDVREERVSRDRDRGDREVRVRDRERDGRTANPRGDLIRNVPPDRGERTETRREMREERGGRAEGRDRGGMERGGARVEGGGRAERGGGMDRVERGGGGGGDRGDNVGLDRAGGVGPGGGGGGGGRDR
jgi:uncharacterized protein YraI